MSRYLGLFAQEATEHLEELGREIVRLERERDPALVDSMFRHAHSVKGMAASMGFTGIAQLAHRTEDLVDRVRKDAAVLTPAVVDVLLQASDRLLDLVRVASAGEDPPPPGPVLERLAETLGTTTPAVARRLRVSATIAASCPTPGVRAFLVHRKLAVLGDITEAEPSLEDCRAGRIPGGKLSLLLSTEAGAEGVQRVLAQIPDVEAVLVEPAPEQPETPEPPVPGGDDRTPSTVRVRTELLDYFLDSVGELLIATARLREIARGLPERERPVLDDGIDALHRIVKELHGKVMTVRMTPVALLLEQLPRVARDVARSIDREVEVVLEGTEIEIDRAILEELTDALHHVIRNAVDHGLESPEDRRAAGKPVRGRIRVSARRDRDRVVLEVEDDGRGMDAGKLRRAAVERGAISADAAAALGDREALLLSCVPGVSTATSVTDLSGRGVGMDAVKRTVESLGGVMEIDSAPGRGTRFIFRLPLTVAVVPVLLVSVGGEVFGVPLAKVVGAVEAAPADLKRSVGTSLLPFGEELLPVFRLGELVGAPVAPHAHRLPHLVLEGDSGRVALQVDALLGQEEAVLKAVTSPLDLLPGLAGVTILGTGRPVFILDVPRLVAA